MNNDNGSKKNKRVLKFLRHIVKKDGFENLILTGQIEGKRAKEKERTTYLANLSEWVVGQVLGEMENR